MQHTGMSITLRQLVDYPDLRLRLVCDGGGDALDSGIVWVHPTDVVNAADYAEPGEVLLTCATNFPLESMGNENDLSLLRRDRRKLGLSASGDDVDASYRELWMCYVAALSRAGVTAIGFGVKMKHPCIPVALLEAVKRYRIVLFEVPVEINFSQITKTVMRAQSEENENVQRIMYTAQRELLTAAAGDDPLRDVVARLAKLVDGWSAYVDGRMRVMALSNQTMRPRALRIARRLVQQKTSSGSDMSPVFGSLHDVGQYCACAVREGKDRSGILIVFSTSSGMLGSVARAVCMAGADALSWGLPRWIVRSRGKKELRAAVLEDLAEGRQESALGLMGVLWPRRPRLPVVLCCMEYPGDVTPEEFMLSMESVPLSTTVHGDYRHRFWVVGELEDVPGIEFFARERGLPCGTSRIDSWSDAPRGFRSALDSLRLRVLRAHGEIGDVAPLELVNPELAQAYGQSLLAPLHELPSEERTTLITTLREMMSSAFSVSVVARSLGCHRHTIENRMRRVERLLGVDFAQESSRIRVWMALSFVRDRS